ncbi:TlpA family protein disulfide reductase [Pedobacter deserti]|uniref:TlpA family protein disulfide reductase n=1 Tax=Pedobacter deserti TaxID=2817382 RepID=UPI00210D206F|nr:TlpA disulfide reductase family protein [Pedobacter sp. SYSU D00382]
MKKLMFLLLISSTAWAQQPEKKKYNLNDFSVIAAVEEQEKYYNDMLKQSPADKSKPRMYDAYLGQLAAGWLAKGNFERYHHYMASNPKISPVSLMDMGYALEAFVDDDKHIKMVEQVSRELLQKMEQGSLADGLGRTQVLLEVNALANAKLGNLDIAKKNIASSGTQKDNIRNMKYFKDSKARYLTRYSQILSAGGEHKRALDTLTEAFRHADSHPKMVTVYMDIYKKVHGSTDGAEQKIKALKDEAYKKYYQEVEQSYIAKAQKTMQAKFALPGGGEEMDLFQAKPIQDLALENLSQKKVKFSELSGKIVVLDFWSTGCTPCVAAFGGFEKVVADYKNEPFQLFVVNLFEDHPTVKTFVTRRGITLDVLRDEENAAFNIQGTPTKIVYDPAGNIRFYAVGYAGSTDREYYKLKAMVEIIKARSSSDKTVQGK